MRIDRVAFAANMARKDINMKILASRTGLSRSTVTAVKSGKTCSEETGRKIAAALGVDVEQLIAEEG